MHLRDHLPLREEMSDLPSYIRAHFLYRKLAHGGYTGISARRGRTLHRLARTVTVAGALVDCGVWNGGSTALLSAGDPEREVWAFDSFEGMPAQGPHDGPYGRDLEGATVGSEDMLRQAVCAYGNIERLHVRKGWFEDTLSPAVEEVGPVAVLNADSDWYESVKLTLDTFYPSVPSGGYVLIDDYGAWPGSRRAADEYREGVGDTTALVATDYTGRYWQKP